MRRLTPALAALATLTAGEALAQDSGLPLILQGWSVSGEARAEGDYYMTNGAAANSAFPFDGGHAVTGFSAQFIREMTGNQTLEGQISMSGDASDYFEASDNAVTLERLGVEYVNGDAAVPFRLEMGDFLAFYTRPTLQRSLKGAQLELQPSSLQSDQMAGSVQFSAGNTAPAYNLIGQDNASFLGASLVVNHVTFGDYAAQVVHGSQESFDGTGDALNQWVTSLAGSRNFAAGSQTLTLDAEMAFLFGDVNDGNVVRDERALAGFVDLSGRSEDNKLRYGVELERATDGFTPLGGQARADRYRGEGNVSYRFESNHSLRFSASQTEEELTDDKTLRRSARVSLSGPVPELILENWTFFSDVFRVHNRNQSRSTNNVTWTGNANFSGPLAEGYNGSVGFFVNDLDDRLNNNDTVTYQATGEVSHRRTIGEYNLDGALGMTARTTNAQNDQIEYGPTARFGVSRENHSLRLDYRRLDTRNQGNNASDLITDNLSFNYSYFTGPHRFEARLGYFGRNPDGDEQTDTFFGGLTYRYRFGEPPRPAIAAAAPLATLSDSLKLSSLPPGIPARTADIILPALGVDQRLGDQPLLIAQVDMYPVDGRQRLIVEQADGIVRRTGAVIDTLGLDADEIADQLDRLERFLIGRYGPPVRQEREGEIADFFGSSSVLPVILTEWRLPTGGTLRLGIPPRLGVQPRIEVIAAQDFPAGDRGDWGFATVN
ncbi:MAG: hypothetical protein ACMVY4_19140 [Minwuia sp.]|uniref:hypothetical protein n=1 Tax=Minwuia sp. TaxID=2493630 RepID=UPI003A8A07A9